MSVGSVNSGREGGRVVRGAKGRRAMRGETKHDFAMNEQVVEMVGCVRMLGRAHEVDDF